MEEVYRARLRKDPCDTLARARLAWCLFLQSLHKAGQESIIQSLSQGLPQVDTTGLRAVQGGPEAQELLDECLRHTETVLHLTMPGEQRFEMERLLGLARLTLGDTAFSAAEQKAHQILDSLIRDLNSPGDPGEP